MDAIFEKVISNLERNNIKGLYAKDKAEAKKLAIVAQMESELVIEGLIKAKGFEDCFVTNIDPNVKIVVTKLYLLIQKLFGRYIEELLAI